MGAGLALQIKNLYPNVFEEYTVVCKSSSPSSSLLGTVLIVPISESQCIANLFAQDGYASYGFTQVNFTNYEKLRECLKTINNAYAGKKVALPYSMGCGLAGGDWNIVSKIIEESLVDCSVEVYML